MAQTRAYNQQLETQFQVQLQMVQILKEQLIKAQNLAVERKSSTGLGPVASELLGISLTGSEREEYFEGKIKTLLEKKKGTGMTEEERDVTRGLTDLLSHCGFAAKESERMNSELESARLAAKEAKEKAELIGKQHREAIVQLGVLQKVQYLVRCITLWSV